MSAPLATADIHSHSFNAAELRSEWARVGALLAVFISLLALVLIRGALGLADGQHGEAWPFALLLAAITAYEVLWLRFVRHAMSIGQAIPRARWTANLFIESLLPTTALLLQVQTPSFGPVRALTSPVVLAYFFFIILSTLHLEPVLSHLAGAFASVGYAIVAGYIFLQFPETARQWLVAYASSFSIAALLLIGGFAAGAVARQIRQHVLATLYD